MISTPGKNRAGLNRFAARLDENLATFAFFSRGGGIERAAVADRAEIGRQVDIAAFVHHGAGADGAGVVDRQRVDVAIGRAEFRPGRRDGAGIGDAGLAYRRCRRRGGFDEDPLGAGLRDENIVARCESDRALGRRDCALVIHRLADQHHVATQSVDRAQILHAVFVAAGEVEFAREKVAVRDVARAGRETVGVDRAALADEDAVAVDQVNLTIGIERTVDDRTLATGHTIEHRTLGIRLDEAGRLALVDGEGIPVDDRRVAVLTDDGRTGSLID